MACYRCQRIGNMGKKNEMPQQSILKVEMFDLWGLNFIGPFLTSLGNQCILVAVDYVSKWVEAIALPNNTTKSVVRFVTNNIFCCFGVPRVIISDNGVHFQNAQLKSLLSKFRCNHKTGTTYQP